MIFRLLPRKPKVARRLQYILYLGFAIPAHYKNIRDREPGFLHPQPFKCVAESISIFFKNILCFFALSLPYTRCLETQVSSAPCPVVSSNHASFHSAFCTFLVCVTPLEWRPLLNSDHFLPPPRTAGVVSSMVTSPSNGMITKSSWHSLLDAQVRLEHSSS